MSNAPSSQRIRQIAILVSSVDAAAARQLLLHLPSATAQQVRQVAAQLGPVSLEEKRHILAAFQQTASSGASAGEAATAASTAATPDVKHIDTAVQELSRDAGSPQAPNAETARNLNNQEQLGNEEHSMPASDVPWAGISREALLRFVRGERPAVIAVVVSQLPPTTAVEILEELGTGVSCQVVQRLSQLENIDPEAKAAIDEHLSERLGQQQHLLDNELANSKRLTALFDRAPIELKSQWQQALDEVAPDATRQRRPSAARDVRPADSSDQLSGKVRVVPLNDRPAVDQPATRPAPMPTAETMPIAANAPDDPPPPSLAELYGDAAITTSDVNGSPASPELLPFPSAPQSPDATPSTFGPPNTASSSGAPAGVSASTDAKDRDRSLLQLEFERLLDLPPEHLANLLSQAESQTVLLALAGASSKFMRRFYNMLDRKDARALEHRLSRIGALKIRDIDEAQRRIVDQAQSILDLPAQAARAA